MLKFEIQLDDDIIPIFRVAGCLQSQGAEKVFLEEMLEEERREVREAIKIEKKKV